MHERQNGSVGPARWPAKRAASFEAGCRVLSALGLCLLLWFSPAQAHQAATGEGLEVYQALKRFSLSGGTAVAENLILKRDRAEMTFDGKFYFEAPVAGRVRGAIFLGRGMFRAQVPPSSFERDNVQRLLKAGLVESDFRTAVLRFTDDTFDHIGKKRAPSEVALPEAQKLATDLDARLLRETGANISARLAVSILNKEDPGVFFAQFDKGKRGRFSLLLDPQGRIPVATFDINGGEKGLIFAHHDEIYGNEVWMAFYSLADYERGRVQYTDAFDLVEIRHYAMQVDVRDPKKVLKVQARLDCESLVSGLRAIPLSVNESLPEFDSVRLKKALRLSKTGRGTVHAIGPQTPFTLKLPAKPEEVELDPDLWILSEKTTTARLK